MAKSDHWLYWEAMALLRAEGSALLAPQVPVAVVDGCPWKKDIPKDERKLMPKPWAELDIQPTGKNLQSYVFPVSYFEWCLRYLAAAKTFKPLRTASTKAQVLWALDVWTHIVRALAATNINWSDAVPRSRSLAARRLVPIVRRFQDFRSGSAQGSFGLALDTARYLESKHRFGGAKKDWDAARWHHAPFMELPQDWVRESRTMAEKFCLYMPWVQGGGDFGSKGRKDSSEMSKAVAASDHPLVNAIFQWRLMSLRDWDTADYWEDQMPLSMGDDSLNTRTLGSYIDHVYKYESRSPDLELHYPGLLPNFQFSYENGLPRLIDLMTTTAHDAWGQARSRYTLSIQEHLLYWVADASPHMEAGGGGQVRMRTDVDQPVSCADFRDLHRRATKALEAGRDAAFANPAIGVAASKAIVNEAGRLAAQAVSITREVGERVAILSNVALTAGQIAAAVLGAISAIASYIPYVGQMLALFTFLMQALAWLLKETGALAVGAAHLPFFPIPNPFTRTLKARGYRTAPTGSTQDLMLRVMDACLNIELATGIDLGVYDGARWTPTTAQQLRDRLAVGQRSFVLPMAPVLPKREPPKPIAPAPPKREPPKPTREAIPTVVVEGTPGGALVRAFAFTGNPFRLFSRERRT